MKMSAFAGCVNFWLLMCGIYLVLLSFGVKRITQLITSTYIAFAIFSVSPFFDIVLERNKLNDGSTKSLLFVLLVVVVAFFYSYRGIRGLVRSWLRTTVLSIIEVGLLATLSISFLPHATLKTISPFVSSLFTGEAMILFWTIIPLLVFFFWHEE